MINIRKLEAELWESADLLRAGSKLTSNQYCMPVLGLIFLRYAYSRFKMVEAEILKNRPMRGGRVLPVEASDFASKSALFLPKEAQYEYLVNLPADIASAGLTNQSGHTMNSLGEVVNNAMELVEAQSEQLTGVLPKDYTMFSDELLSELLRIFNNSALDEVGGDIIGRIYEYFLNKFAKNIAQDDGVFFTPKSLVKMIVNVLEPSGGVLLDPYSASAAGAVATRPHLPGADGAAAYCAAGIRVPGGHRPAAAERPSDALHRGGRRRGPALRGGTAGGGAHSHHAQHLLSGACAGASALPPRQPAAGRPCRAAGVLRAAVSGDRGICKCPARNAVFYHGMVQRGKLRISGTGAGFCHPPLGDDAGKGPLAPERDLHGGAPIFREDQPDEGCSGPEQCRGAGRGFGAGVRPERHEPFRRRGAGDRSAEAGSVLPRPQ